MAKIRTLIKSALQSEPSGMRAVDLAESIGANYANTYHALQGMVSDGQVDKVARGVFALSEIPRFSTAECISLLQSLESQEKAVENAQEKLHRAETQLRAVKRTIKSTMMSALDE